LKLAALLMQKKGVGMVVYITEELWLTEELLSVASNATVVPFAIFVMVEALPDGEAPPFCPS
jgi:hypothetical protein